ncbi:hypothetical protein GALL_505850 [mine drainage metagenome]|uniref:Uncharacterized protein n=1 Tax=mine drainage metagenome TaxID=410659 RepID=A0A1J5PRB9_9ZZZZ
MAQALHGMLYFAHALAQFTATGVKQAQAIKHGTSRTQRQIVLKMGADGDPGGAQDGIDQAHQAVLKQIVIGHAGR